MKRWFDFGFLLLWSWLCMTLLHEGGHILIGCAAGGDLAHYELRPWCLPHSLFSSNAFPMATLWAGPLLGSLVPLIVAAIFRRPALWFVAWFCVVANGLYLLLGYYAGDNELDSTKMIAAGTPAWLLLVVGLAGTVAGYVGLRAECQRVLDPKTTALSFRTISLSAGGMLLLVLWLAAFGAR